MQTSSTVQLPLVIGARHRLFVCNYADVQNARFRWRMIALPKALLWPTYTNIGADDRDQFAMVRSMPGNLTNVVAQLHGRGVQVLWSVPSRHLLPPPSSPPALRWHSLPAEPPLRVSNNVVDLPHLMQVCSQIPETITSHHWFNQTDALFTATPAHLMLAC